MGQYETIKSFRKAKLILNAWMDIQSDKVELSYNVYTDKKNLKTLIYFLFFIAHSERMSVRENLWFSTAHDWTNER
jgi:hypothetical protein